MATVIASCVTTKMPDAYKVDPNPMVNKGGKVSVNVSGTIPAKSFHKKAIVEFQPYIKYNGGSLDLKPLTLKGEKAVGEGTVINTKLGGSFSYSDVFDYKPEMQSSELWVKIKVKKGSKELNLEDVKLADGIIITALRVGHGEDVQMATHNYIKETFVTKSANIYFAYNKSNLDWNLKLNKDNAKAYSELKDFIALGYAIKEVKLDAWASPEGELTLNQKLSDERAAVAKKEFTNEVNKMIKAKGTKLTIKSADELKMNVASKGADFEGFMKALDASDIKDKDKISNVIKSQGTKDAREQQIRNMTVIYAEIENMLSVLRRAEITVTCYEPKLTDQQISDFAINKPDTLKLEELMYAASLTSDANVQMKIYKNINKVYPTCWRAWNNLAALQIKSGDIEGAAANLAKANELKPNNGMVLNNLGVVAAWKKDYKAAESYYTEARNNGVNVSYNMGVIQMLKGDYANAEKAFASKTCDYNLALAKLVNGNAADATKTLDCAAKTAESYYLLAVIGARTNNTSMLYDNLKKACEMVPGFKNEAKLDAEFITFKDKAEFKAIVD